MRDSERAAMVAGVVHDLMLVDAHITAALANLGVWVGQGYPTASMPEVVVAGGVPSDPVGDLVGRDARDAFVIERHLIDSDLIALRSVSRHLVTVVVRNAQRSAPGMIDCTNGRCERRMTGQGNDRPRGQRRLCPRCYQHWKRYRNWWPETEPLLVVTVDEDVADTL